MSVIERCYSTLMRRQREAEDELPDEVQANVPANGLRLVGSQALQSSGDQTANASTVLPWLFATLGVPAALTGILVPIRESGSMLPQAFLTPLIVRIRYRKWVMVAGALVQALAVAVMAATAALGSGLVAGVIIVAALAVFATGRSLSSIASKDVQGRTIPKGERGQINGLGVTAGGIVAISLGLAVRYFGGQDMSPGQLAFLLALGCVFWVAVAAVCASINEPPGEPVESSSRDSAPNSFAQTLKLLKDDKTFRDFVGVRSLLLVSSLSPPFIVTMSIHSGVKSLAGLGGFVIASGFAAVIGGRIFGRFADRSSKKLMSIGAGIASTVIVVNIAVVALFDVNAESLLGNLMFISAYFSITLMHTGVRVGRKTYVVDMAEGDLRTTYVAVSNSAMGLILLIVGGISSLFALIHVFAALLFLAALGYVGVFAGAQLPDVSRA